MSIKDRIILMCRQSILCLNEFEHALDEIARIQQAENLLASVSSFGFVFAFRDIAQIICYRQADSNTEKYISLCSEAAELLASGVSRPDVLCYFESLINDKRNF